MKIYAGKGKIEDGHVSILKYYYSNNNSREDLCSCTFMQNFPFLKFNVI